MWNTGSTVRRLLEFEAWTDDWFTRKESGKWDNAPEYGLARSGLLCSTGPWTAGSGLKT